MTTSSPFASGPSRLAECTPRTILTAVHVRHRTTGPCAPLIDPRRIEKVDAEKMVNAIWDAKDEWEAKNKGARVTLADFMVGKQLPFGHPRHVSHSLPRRWSSLLPSNAYGGRC